MTVATLPGVRLTAVPVLSRDERIRELQALAEDASAGTGPSPRVTDIVIRILAHDSLQGHMAPAAWKAYLVARDELAAVEAGEPDYRDAEPARAEARVAATLNLLLDGAS